MRRPLLLLPVLLVILIAGYAQGKAPEVEAGLEPAEAEFHPVKEQAEIRGTREAVKKHNAQKTGVGKAKRIKRRLKKKATKPDKGKMRKGKGKQPPKRQANTDSKKKRKRRKQKKKNNEKSGTKKKKKKKKHRRRKNKLKKKKKDGKKKGLKQASGGDWSSCGTTGVNDTCLINAVNALNFEKNQIMNFFKQKKRMENQATQTGKKMGKKGEFADAAKYMLMALGGDINNVTCGEGNTSTRGAKKASETYAILINCSVSVMAACNTPNTTMNSTFNENCATIYNLSKIASKDCRTNTNYTENGPLACNCWEKASIGIQIAKNAGCSAKGKSQAKAMNAQKKKCIKALSACKQAEDSAVGLIHTCMSGEVNTNSSASEGRRVF